MHNEAKTKFGNKGMYEYVPYNKYYVTEFEIQIAKYKESVNHSSKTETMMFNSILKVGRDDTPESSFRRATIHDYDDYSDEEKTFSTINTQPNSPRHGAKSSFIPPQPDIYDNNYTQEEAQKQATREDDINVINIESEQKNDVQVAIEWKTIALIMNYKRDRQQSILNNDNDNEVIKWSYTIRNLYKNNQYLVRIRCKNELGGFGDFSDNLVIKTLNEKQKENLEWFWNHIH